MASRFGRMTNPSNLRELIDAVEIPDTYRGRVERYGSDAARSLLWLYDTLKEHVRSGSDDRPPQMG